MKSRFQEKSVPSAEVAGRGSKLTYINRVFKEEYRPLARSVKADEKTWMRLVPRGVGSTEKDFIRKYESFIVDVNGVKTEYLDPASIDPSRRSFPKEVMIALRTSEDPTIKAKAYSSENNPKGINVQGKKKMFAFYVENQAVSPGESTLKIINGGANDGVIGSPGMMHNLFTLYTEAKDGPNVPEELKGTPKNPYLAGGERGNVVGLLRKGAGLTDTSYTWSVDDVEEKPIDEYFDKMPVEEQDLFTDLENTLYLPSDEEIKEAIISLLGEDLFYTLLPQDKINAGNSIATSVIEKEEVQPEVAPEMASFQKEEPVIEAPVEAPVEAVVEETSADTEVTNKHLADTFNIDLKEGIPDFSAESIQKVTKMGEYKKTLTGSDLESFLGFIDKLVEVSPFETKAILKESLIDS